MATKGKSHSESKSKVEGQKNLTQGRLHGEGSGDAWLVLTGQNPALIMPQIVGTVIAEGGTRPVWQWKHGSREYILLAWPQEQPVRAAVLMAGEEKEKLKPVSAFPLLEGLPNDLTVEEIHPRKEGEGADVAVEMLEGKNPMWFFDPLYQRDKEDLTPGVTHTFWLAGVALGIRKALLDHITITQGMQYEAYAEQWLAANPDKKSSDVPPMRVEIKDKHIIMPGRHFGEYQIRGVIERIEDWQFEKMPLKALYLSFPFDNRPPLRLVLYASKFSLGEYEPEAGHEIESYVWLEGRIIDLDTDSTVNGS